MTQSPDAIAERLQQRVDTLAREASRYLGHPLPAMTVRLDLRGLAAGRCHVRGRQPDIVIRFNCRVMTDDDLFHDAWQETAPHEVAHAAVSAWALSNGRRVRPHGPEWLQLCRALGGSGDTTHRLPLQRARRHREFEYQLTDGERVWLGSVRHGRLQRGRARYYHRRRPVLASQFTGRQRLRR